MSFYPTYCIQAEWGRDTVSPSDIRARIVEMVHGLGQLVPSKDHWRFVDGDDFKITPSAEATADIGPFLKRNIRATGVGEPDSREGYLLVLIGSEDDSDTVAGNDLHVMAPSERLRLDCVSDLQSGARASRVSLGLPLGAGPYTRQFGSPCAAANALRRRLDRLSFVATRPRPHTSA
jgi:hypothetical protein